MLRQQRVHQTFQLYHLFNQQKTEVPMRLFLNLTRYLQH